VNTTLKVGALAKRTGLTVRTLHHYDEIGLLAPTQRTASGHRLYGEAELERLQQIASLKQLGLTLDEIRDCLTRPQYSLERVLTLQIERLQEQIHQQERLRSLIESLRDRVRSGEAATVDELTQSISVTVNYSRYYSDEQLESLATKAEEIGPGPIAQAQVDWAELFGAFEDAMRCGLDPSDPQVASLAKRASALIEQFTGGDPEMAASLTKMYKTEGPDRIAEGHGMHMAPGLWAYMGAARAAIATGG